MEAVTEFFEDYSGYVNQPLFITGESYGGTIATLLALRIDERNKLALVNPSLGTPWQLKGLILGNPLIDPSVDATPSLVETLY